MPPFISGELFGLGVEKLYNQNSSKIKMILEIFEAKKTDEI